MNALTIRQKLIDWAESASDEAIQTIYMKFKDNIDEDSDLKEYFKWSSERRHIYLRAIERKRMSDNKGIAFNTLEAPAHFEGESLRNKILFCLSEIGEGTAVDVTMHLLQKQTGLKYEEVFSKVKMILNRYYNKGEIEGRNKFRQVLKVYKLGVVCQDIVL